MKNRKQQKAHFLVSINLPQDLDLNLNDLREYIRDSIETMWGSHEPPGEHNDFQGSPFWNLSKWGDVRVKHYHNNPPSTCLKCGEKIDKDSLLCNPCLETEVP